MLTSWQTALLAANVLALLLLLLRGERPERIAAVLVIAILVIEPLAYPLRINAWRVGGLLVNLGLFVGLAWLAERWDRWWLIFVGGLQLLLTMTFLMPLMTDEFSVRTGIALRLGIWGAISLIFFVGVWEASAARRFAQEAAQHDPPLRRSRHTMD